MGYESCWKGPLTNSWTIYQIFLDLFRKDVLLLEISAFDVELMTVSMMKSSHCYSIPLVCVPDKKMQNLFFFAAVVQR